MECDNKWVRRCRRGKQHGRRKNKAVAGKKLELT